jgi:hypothetical protein
MLEMTMNHVHTNGDVTDNWNAVRYSGLIEFSKGHYDAANALFRKALNLSRTMEKDAPKEALSTYDLAEVCKYMETPICGRESCLSSRVSALAVSGISLIEWSSC